MNQELKRKVRPLPPHAIRHMEQKANELVAELGGQFRAFADGALAEIDRLMAAPCYDDREWRARLNALAHELKGLGGTFGYDLMTTVADSMCRSINNQTVATDEGLQRRLEASVPALKASVQFDLKRDGGSHGRELLATLQLTQSEHRVPTNPFLDWTAN
jgi:hypothetical protein